MSKDLRYWIKLSNSRGLAGANATADREDQAVIERSQLGKFDETLTDATGLGFSRIEQKEPPHPDFLVERNNLEISVELTEFMDPVIVQEAKHIRADASHKLHKEAIYFHATESWFHDILAKSITRKNDTYRKKGMIVDMLLIDNELEDLSIEDTRRWLNSFSVPSCEAIKSIYLQSWYHPAYLKYPTWSVVSHPEIGELTPRLKRES